MSWRETASIVIRARREGVTLSAKADDKLGWKADRPPSDELLIILKKHKADILALIRPLSGVSVAIGPARSMLQRVRSLRFEAALSDAGALGIVDLTGRNRSLALCLPIGEAFDTIVAGLAEDPDLLDLDTATTEPDLSDLNSLEPDLSEPELFEPGPPGLAEDPRLLDSMTEEERQ
jgi:hypothetical protein